MAQLRSGGPSCPWPTSTPTAHPTAVNGLIELHRRIARNSETATTIDYACCSSPAGSKSDVTTPRLKSHLSGITRLNTTSTNRNDCSVALSAAGTLLPRHLRYGGKAEPESRLLSHLLMRWRRCPPAANGVAAT
jgi:hypothetical protein